MTDQDHGASLAHASKKAEAITSASGKKTVNGCYMTLLTKDSYIQGLLVLHRSFKAVFTAYPLIAIVTPALPQASRKLVNHAGIRIIDVEPLKPKAGTHELSEPDKRLEDTWMKLRAWEIVEFDRIVLLDCDMLVFKNMDELFELELPGDEWIACAHACTCNPAKHPHFPADWIPENCGYTPCVHPYGRTHPTQITASSPRTHRLLNSGLVVLQPSLKQMNEIVHFIATSPEIATYKFPDQDVLASIYTGRWMPLPWVYNALKTLRSVHKPLWRDEEAKNIHYHLDKPWEQRPGPNASWPVTGTMFAEEHGWWWVQYDQMLDEMKKDPQSGWEIVDRWVAH